MYEQLLSLDAITINFNEGGINAINWVLAFIMFGVALGIRPSMFKEVFSKPKSVVVGLLLQWIGLPAITFLLVSILSPWITPMVALGMLLVASCPGGNISNFMSSFSKGNVELSVSMTAVSTCTATFITPINFAFWGKMYVNLLVRKGAMTIPELTIAFWPMFWQVCLLLGIPIILGMLFTKYCPNWTEKVKKPMQGASIVFFMAMIVISFSQNFTIFINHIWYVFFIVMAHNFLALSLGYWGARAAKLPVRDRRSLTIEVGIQNSGLGLVLLFNPNIFPQEGTGGMLFITAWWGIWHIVSGLTVATLFRRKSLKDHETC